jgi:hypothetical protein
MDYVGPKMTIFRAFLFILEQGKIRQKKPSAKNKWCNGGAFTKRKNRN